MDNQWTTVIRPRRKWWDISIKEIFDYKYLLYLFVKRDFNIVFKQTILGPAWYIIQPLFTSGIFTMIFGAIAKLPTDGIPQPLFYFSGIALWSYFSALITTTSLTFQNNSGMFNKVYYPRLVVPLSLVVSKFITFGIQLIFMTVLYVAFLISGSHISPSLFIVCLPVLFGMTAILALGIGLWVAGWSVKYRDLTNLLSFGVGLLMYATPVIFPLSMVPGKWKFLMYCNPMTAIMELFRYSLFGQGSIDPLLIITSSVSTIIIFIIGVLIFSRAEQTAMDVV